MHDEQGTPPESSWRVPESSIRRFYLYNLLTRTEFTGAIWIIYLKSKGFSLTEIGLSEAAFHLAPVLLELPSGSFADLIGRRWSLALGAFLIAVSSFMLLIADSLPMAILALFLSGASYSFRSGADQAYLYDAMSDAGTGFANILGKLFGAMYLVGGITVWVGAAISEYSFTYAFALAIAVALAGAFLATTLVEPAVDSAERAHRSILAHLHDVRFLLHSRPHVTAMLLFSGAFWTAGTIVWLYLQAVFHDRGLTNTEIGLILGGGTALSAVGAALAGRISKSSRFRTQFIALAPTIGALIIGTAAGNIYLAVGSWLAANVVIGALEPLMYAWFNHNVPSRQRATVLSVESWTFSALMIPFFPLGGWVAERFGWGPMIVGCGVISIALVALVLIGGAIRRQPATAAD